MFYAVLLLGTVLLLVIAQAVRRAIRLKRITIFDYQRGVLYRNGIFAGVVDPGAHWTSARSQIISVDIRRQLMQLPGQEILTTDSINLKVSSVVDYVITDPALSIQATGNLAGLLYSLAQQALRASVAELPFEVLLTSRAAIDTRMLALVNLGAAELGVTVNAAQVRDIMLPSDMRRAYAQAITAQKEALAAVERSRGETASLRALANAARMLQDHPGLLQLRAVQAIETSRGNHTLRLDLSSSSSVQEPGA